MLVFCVAFVHVHCVLALSNRPGLGIWAFGRSCARVQHFHYPLPLARRFRTLRSSARRFAPELVRSW